MKIQRIYDKLGDYLKPNKVLLIYGPRQVGKTTLVEKFLSSTKFNYKLDSGDDIVVKEKLGSENFSIIKEYASEHELIVIDEAQRIKNIGQSLKIMVDQIKGIKIIVTGSSSFELAGQIGEPLTGRKTTLTLFPIAQIELRKLYNAYDLKNKLEEYLVFGSYPEVVTSRNNKDKIKKINEITNSYLLKDVLEFEKIKNSKLLISFLRLLAFQVGNEVSLSEIGQQLGLDHKTVGRYLDILEKAFVLYNLRGFSRNLRNEIKKKSKYYFYDNGVRNSLIANFNPVEMRDDIGKLWENFLFMERLKKQAYTDIYCNNYFWRTWEQKEVDMVEEREGKLFGYEFKWGEKRVNPPAEWLKTYPNAEFHVINKENYLDFVC